MRIAFVTEHNTNDPIARSGVPFNIVKALKQENHEVTVIQVSDKRNIFERIHSRIFQFLISLPFFGKNTFYDASYSTNMSRAYARSVPADKIAEYQLIIAISPKVIAYLPHEGKFILWLDNSITSFTAYPGMENFSDYSLSEAIKVEKRAFEKSHLIFVASRFLKDSLTKEYPAIASKLCIMPRGANLRRFPKPGEVEIWIQQRMNTPILHLLHVVSGRWYSDRKGTKRVIEVYKILLKNTRVKLTILGDVPEEQLSELTSLGIHCSGKLNKETNEGIEDFYRILSTAHFMFVPSKAEGFGIVYAEAAFTGMPSIALNVTGVPDAVKHGITGWLLPESVNTKEMAAFIQEKWNLPNEYREMGYLAHEYAKEHFNWKKNIASIVGQAAT